MGKHENQQIKREWNTVQKKLQNTDNKAKQLKQSSPPEHHIFGLIEKNICMSLRSCKCPEQCQKKNLFHPVWAVELQICVMNLSGKCTFGDDKCKKRHFSWEELRSIVIGSNTEYSKDFFTKEYTKFHKVNTEKQIQEKSEYFFKLDTIDKYKQINNQQFVIQKELNDKYRSNPLNEISKKIKEAKDVANELDKETEAEKCKECYDAINDLKQEYENTKKTSAKMILDSMNLKEDQYNFIDVHGQHRDQAVKFVDEQLNIIYDELANDTLKPNHDENTHIYKIICGKGVHSDKNPGIVRQFMIEYLKENDHEYIETMKHNGVFLVRIQLD